MKKTFFIPIILFSIFISIFIFDNNVFSQDQSSSTPKIEKKLSKTKKEIINKLDDVVSNDSDESKNNSDKPKLKKIFSVNKVIISIFLLILTFYISKSTTYIIDKLSEKSAKYRLTLKGLIPLYQIILWFIAIYTIIFLIFAPPMETLILFSGSASIALGFASQDILKNIFGGIIIMLDKPFQVGDKINVGEHYGEVTQIGLRSTRVVTPDDSLVSIPNSEIMSHSISNSNVSETNCQVVAEIYLPSEIDTLKARIIATKVAQVSKYVYLNKPIAVIFKNELKKDKPFLKMRLKAYVLDIRYEFAFMSELTEVFLKEALNEKLITDDYQVSH